MSVTTIPEAAPTAVRREVERVGWLPAVVSERNTYYLRWQLAEGRCEELAAERDRAIALAADLAGRLAAEEAAGARRLARLAGRPRPSRPAAWWAALCLAWQGVPPAASPWAWPALVLLGWLALALVRW